MPQLDPPKPATEDNAAPRGGLSKTPPVVVYGSRWVVTAYLYEDLIELYASTGTGDDQTDDATIWLDLKRKDAWPAWVNERMLARILAEALLQQAYTNLGHPREAEDVERK